MSKSWFCDFELNGGFGLSGEILSKIKVLLCQSRFANLYEMIHAIPIVRLLDMLGLKAIQQIQSKYKKAKLLKKPNGS